MMKTDNSTHAIRNSKHNYNNDDNINYFLRSTQWRNIGMAWSLDTLVLICLQGHLFH